MKALIAYGTTEGQTEHIAEELARRLAERGVSAVTVDLEHGFPDITGYDRIVVGGSIHMRKYQKEVVKFVQQNVDRLNAMSSWFFGVSLSEAAGDVPDGHPAAQAIIDAFIEHSGWRPKGALSLAGALKYREYNFLKRQVLKRIAAKAGGDTDTSRDWEYTDWSKVDALADEVALAPVGV